MPTLANVVINDGAATPVARTFVPGAKDVKGMQRWYEKTASNAIGFWALGQSLREPLSGARQSTSDRVYRFEYVLQLPTLESTSASTGTGIPPAPTVAYSPQLRIVATLPERSTTQDRKHLRVLTANWLAHANAIAVFDNLEPVYVG